MAAEMNVVLVRYLPHATIAHIGSTAVPGLPAKPVVDLMAGVPANELASAAHTLARHGFDLEGDRSDHAWLSYPDRSARTFVIHVVELHGQQWRNRVRFREILRADTTSRQAYLAAKRSAAASSRDWAEYTSAKASIVAEILATSSIGRSG